ncbi:MAG TPA: hypothetical protein VHA56_02695 [Mucilaginibacter sp.]|nr:hypothetical protein [Mucilaginibacter sp.]
MLLAYQKYLYIMRQLEVSDRFPETPAKPGFELQAGFYKLSEFSPEHVIAFTSFSGGHFPLIKSTEQRAGRRGKGKKSTYVALIARRWGEASSLAFFSRLLMVVFPSVLELKTIKNKV